MVDHKATCATTQARCEKDRGAWRQRWPSHCPDCEGWGGDTFRYDPSPPGVCLSSGYMEEFEFCAECVCQGKCPRCGVNVWTEDADFRADELTCPECGFVVDKDEGMPKAFECSCWEDEG